MGEHFIDAQPGHFPYRRHGGGEFLHLLFEPFPFAFPVVMYGRLSRDEPAPYPALHGRWRTPGDGHDGLAFEMAAFLRVMDGGFVIDHGADRIGHRSCGPGRAGIANEVHLIGKAFIETQQGAVGQGPLGIKFFNTCRIKVGSLTGEHDHAGPILHDQRVAFGEGEVELVGQAALAVFAALQPVLFEHR